MLNEEIRTNTEETKLHTKYQKNCRQLVSIQYTTTVRLAQFPMDNRTLRYPDLVYQTCASVLPPY